MTKSFDQQGTRRCRRVQQNSGLLHGIAVISGRYSPFKTR